MSYEQAVAALRSGRLQEAQMLLQGLARAVPPHPEALQLLGLVLCRQGRVEEGLATLEEALASRPDHVTTRFNRAQALSQLGRHGAARDDLERVLQAKPDFEPGWLALGSALAGLGDTAGAERAYRKAIALNEAGANAHYNLALLLHTSGRIEEAIAGYRKALAREARFAAAHNNLANALRQAGRREESLRHYEAAVAIDPELADAHANYGTALQEQGRFADALRLLERAAGLRPASAAIQNNLGIAYFAMNRLAEAEAAYRRALALDPEFYEALNNLANALASAGRDDEAMAYYHRVIERAPGHADAHSNLGLQLQERGAIDEAMACYARALALKPDHADALNNQGYLLQEQGRRAEAMALYRQALAADPRSARAAYNLGLAQLCERHFREGWEGCEMRYYTTPPIAVLRPFTIPTFSAGDWGNGHKLAIWREQGIGDQVLYATLVPELEARGQDFVLEIDARLHAAFTRSHPNWKVVAPEQSQAAFAGCDRQLAGASLPRLLRPSVESFERQPRALLRADPGRAAAYRARLARPCARLVGISWRSFQPKARSFLERKKSAPLAAFAPLSRRADVTLLDLQYGDTAAQREAFEHEHRGRLEHLPDLDLFSDIDGVLAAVEACDLVVTTSNVTAHYAGVLGKPALLLYLAANPPFHYWSTDASGRCLWYPSLRIVTGPDLTDWPRLLAYADELLDA